MNITTNHSYLSSSDYKHIYESLPVTGIILKADPPLFTILTITDELLFNTKKKRAEVIGKPLFEVYPPNPDLTDASGRNDVAEAFERVIITKEPNQLVAQRYDVVNENGHFEERYWQANNKPLLDEYGAVISIIHTVIDVTDTINARKIDKNLHFKEQAFKLFMQAPVAICIITGDDQVIEFANDQMLNIWGKNSDVVSKPLLQALPEIENTVFPQLLKKVKQTGIPYTARESQAYFVRNGVEELVYFDFVYQPYYEDTNNAAIGVLVVASDITEQVIARKKVEESEQMVRSFVESAPFPIAVYFGREMRIQLANQSLKDTWGKGNDIIGKLYAEVLPELANQDIYNKLDEVFTTGIAYHARNQRVDLHVDGRLQSYYFNYSFTPLYDAEGKIYGVMNTGHEVTELVVAYNKLEESEEQSRLAIEASEQGTFTANLITNELAASKRLSEICDIELDADRDRFVSAIHPDDLVIRQNAYKTAFETGILDYDGRVIRKDGFVVWVRVKGRLYNNASNQPHRIVGIVQDITEHKEFAQALAKKVEERTAEIQEANKQLQRYNDELQQFAYVASHDLQEPLRKIMIFGSMLSANLYDGEKINYYVNKIASSSKRMSGLIQSLLEYSRAANIEKRFEKVDLTIVIKGIIEDYELTIEEKDALVSIEGLHVIDAIPLQINHLFYNLLGNALKFTKAGIRPEITIKGKLLNQDEMAHYAAVTNKQEHIAITIEDNGIGFDQNYATRIFTVFQRLNDLSNYSGYGIGLAISKKAVEIHNGLIIAEGKKDIGARFTVILPVEQNVTEQPLIDSN